MSNPLNLLVTSTVFAFNVEILEMSLRSSKWPREGAPGPAVRDFPDQQFPDSVSLRPKSLPCRFSKPRWNFAPVPY